MFPFNFKFLPLKIVCLLHKDIFALKDTGAKQHQKLSDFFTFLDPQIRQKLLSFKK
jgi:hypothetical protein